MDNSGRRSWNSFGEVSGSAKKKITFQQWVHLYLKGHLGELKEISIKDLLILFLGS